MQKRLESISEKRERLVKQAADQRLSLVENIRPLQSSMHLADKGLNVVRYVKKHPVLLLGIVALFGLLRPTRAVKWLRTSWIAAFAIRGLRAWLTNSETKKT